MVATLLAIAAAVFWYRGRTKSSAEAPFFSGYGEGELVYVSSPIAGELQQLAVQRGDQVEKAAFLFELEREEKSAPPGQRPKRPCGRAGRVWTRRRWTLRGRRVCGISA